MSVFEVKWSEESKKVGPNTLQRLLLAKLRLFWKRWFCCFLPQISANHFFRKLIISQKVSIVEQWDQLFWIPCINLHQKCSHRLEKKIYFQFFHSKRTFLPLFSEQPWLISLGTGQWLAAFESRLRVRFAQWSQSASVSRPVPSEIDKRGVLYIFIL